MSTQPRSCGARSILWRSSKCTQLEELEASFSFTVAVVHPYRPTEESAIRLGAFPNKCSKREILPSSFFSVVPPYHPSKQCLDPQAAAARARGWGSAAAQGGEVGLFARPSQCPAIAFAKWPYWVSFVQVPRIWGGAPYLGYWGVPRYSAGREISPYTEEQNRSQGAGGGFGCQSPCPGLCNIVDVRPCVHVCVHVVVRICHLHLYVPYTQCFELGFVCICTLEEFEYWSFWNFGGMFIGSASRSHVGSW